MNGLGFLLNDTLFNTESYKSSNQNDDLSKFVNQMPIFQATQFQMTTFIYI